jgi:tetratricopeptide (TPR) repeat protein
MRRAAFLSAVLIAACTEAPPPEPQATSLLGESLYARVDTTGEIARADSALAAAPDDVERIIAAARVRRNWWQYRDEMALYTRAIELEPGDWRPWRFRGHRHISVREFDNAIRDMERARELAPLNWDVSYHLGLAYFVSGRFADAADEYRRCLGLAGDAGAVAADAEHFRSCSRNGTDPGSRVAMTEWAARALLRAGRQVEAGALAAAIPERLEVGENLSYYHDLLYAKGLKTAEELLNLAPDAPYRLETVGYGVATRLLAAGDTARATDVLRRIVADPWWPGFGRIAAEADLALRLGQR